MGWEGEIGISCAGPSAAGRTAASGINRRPRRRTLASSFRWIIRQTVARETPNAARASSTVSICARAMR